MTVDIAIIGAGIVGVMAAQKVLQKNPDASVLHLEQALSGSGATRFSAAFAPLFGRNDAVLDMAVKSRHDYERLRQALPTLPMHEIPSYWIANEANLAKYNKKLDQSCTEIGSDTDWQSDVMRSTGFSRSPEHTLLTHSIGSYSLPVDFLNVLIAELNRHPHYALRQCLQLTDIKEHPDGYQVTTSYVNTYQAKRVLIAMGPWFRDSPFVHAFDPMDIRLKKVMAFHIHQKPMNNARAIFYCDHDAFLLPIKQAGMWLYSYTCEEWDSKPDCNTLPINQKNLTTAKDVLQQIAPDFVSACAGGSSFCDTYTHCTTPIVQKSFVGDNMVVITGTGGSGFRLAPALAELALESFGDGF